MLRWERIQLNLDEWSRILEGFPDRTLFQSEHWLRFIRESMGGALVFAVLRDSGAERGYFVGMVVRKFGLRVVGSPLPGWTTSYMGLLLKPGTSRLEALNDLTRFAFEDLKCVHLEVMDRQFTATTLDSHYRFRNYNGFEIDLSLDEHRLFANFDAACRRCIKKATRCGVAIEEAADAQFADEYYEQLRDVFAKQGLCPTYSVNRVRKLISHLQPTGNLLLLRARDAQSRCIATGIFPAMNNRAYFWGGASWREHQHLRPNEAMMWYALRYWKGRGMLRFDLGGSGDYKRKYGPYEISVPWLRISRYPVLPALRNGVIAATKLRQRWQALWQIGHAASSQRQLIKTVDI
jgi:CelD/BcsL family acetyltransferase involved in cellulose biosynthesis